MADQWVTGQKALAAALKCDQRTLRRWFDAAWWESSFRKSNRYNVSAIERARPTTKTENEQAQRVRNQIRLAKEREELAQLQFDTRKKQREEARELGNTLPADVYAELVREWLGMLRTDIESLAFEFSQQVPDEFKSLVFNESGKPALLQRMIEVKLARGEQWLKDGEDEAKEDLE